MVTPFLRQLGDDVVDPALGEIEDQGRRGADLGVRHLEEDDVERPDLAVEPEGLGALHAVEGDAEDVAVEGFGARDVA